MFIEKLRQAMYASKFEEAMLLLKDYHKCVKYFNKCCGELSKAFAKAGQPLQYAGWWVHKEGNRIGVLFKNTQTGGEQYVSVPIFVFASEKYADFVKKYCKLEDNE